MSSSPKPVQTLKAHLFVCNNERPAGHPRGCCKEKHSEELLKLLKEELAKAGLSKEVRAQKAGCLDVCEYGPALVIYPEGIWYGQVQASDIPEIVKSLAHGRQKIDRLLIPGK